MSNLSPIPAGTLCQYAGRICRVYPDVRIGQPWAGTYRIQAENGASWLSGITMAELVVLSGEERRRAHRSSQACFGGTETR